MRSSTGEQKERARREAAAAKRSGRLRAPAACEHCGAEGRVEAHHWDYSRPLDVEWLCKRCHAGLHERADECETDEEFEEFQGLWVWEGEDERAYLDPAYPDVSAYPFIVSLVDE